MRCRLLSAVVAALLVPGTGWAQQRVPIRERFEVAVEKDELLNALRGEGGSPGALVQS